MGIREACQTASELNREQEARGTLIRYVVIAEPVGECGGNHQVVARKIRKRATARS